MRRWICVPMILLLLLASGCGGAEEETEDLRERYRTVSGCGMEAEVVCDREGYEWKAKLRCTYVPEGESTVEVLEPETLAGIRAAVSGEELRLEFEDVCLDMGDAGGRMSPAICLPHLMEALRGGWLLEQNEEMLQDVPCVRLTVDRTGENGEKILSTVWLCREDGTPVRGEITAENRIILTAEFTDFTFYDMMSQ